MSRPGKAGKSNANITMSRRTDLETGSQSKSEKNCCPGRHDRGKSRTGKEGHYIGKGPRKTILATWTAQKHFNPNILFAEKKEEEKKQRADG